MALVSGVGGVPFFFVGKMTGKMAGYSNSLACGVMLSASFNLIYDGQVFGTHSATLHPHRTAPAPRHLVTAHHTCVSCQHCEWLPSAVACWSLLLLTHALLLTSSHWKALHCW